MVSSIGSSVIRWNDNFGAVLDAVIQNGEALKEASPTLQHNDHLIEVALEHGLQFTAHSWMSGNKQIALAFVRQDGMRLKDCDPSLRADFDVVLAAVTQNGRAFDYAIDHLQFDDKIADAAVEHGLPIDLRTGIALNRAIVLACLRRDGMKLQYVVCWYRTDRKAVLVAVTQNGLALQFAPYFQSDPEITQAAMLQNPDASAYVKEKSVPKKLRRQSLDLKPFRESLDLVPSRTTGHSPSEPYQRLRNLVLHSDTSTPEEILDIPADASLSRKKVDLAFRKLSLTFHPDRNPPEREKEATALSQCLGKARDTLLNPPSNDA